MVYTSSENYFPLTIMKSFVIAVLALATVAQVSLYLYKEQCFNEMKSSEGISFSHKWFLFIGWLQLLSSCQVPTGSE